MMSLRVGHNRVTSLSLFTFLHWRRKWQPTPVLLPGESHGRRSLVGYSPWGCKESDTTERLHFTSCFKKVIRDTFCLSVSANILKNFPGKNTGAGCHFLLQCMKVKSESEVTRLCPTLSDPMDCSLPGSSIHGIFQARVLEWGAIAFSMVMLGLV